VSSPFLLEVLSLPSPDLMADPAALGVAGEPPAAEWSTSSVRTSSVASPTTPDVSNQPPA